MAADTDALAGPNTVAALVEEHYGAMHRLARLVIRDGRDPAAVTRAAWAAAVATTAPSSLSTRAWLLQLVLGEVGTPDAGAAPPVAPATDFEDDGTRWAGWWKDDLPQTPAGEPPALERALRAIPPALTAVLVLRDVERLDPAEVEALVGHSVDRQLVLLHHGRTAVRSALREAAGP